MTQSIQSISKKQVLVQPPVSEMCPPGYRVITGNTRICQSGLVSKVTSHVRKSRGKSEAFLFRENLHFLFWNSSKEYPSLAPIHGFGKKGSDYDQVIQFWLSHWKSAGVSFPKDLDPLLIKTMIALLSDFNHKLVSKIKKGSAAGLMQVTEMTLEDTTELQHPLVYIEKADRLDPITNIAFGIRLLGHEYAQLQNQKQKSARQLIERYYFQKENGESFAAKVMDLYARSV